MKQFCMKIDLISKGRENVLFLSLNIATMTPHENVPFSGKMGFSIFRTGDENVCGLFGKDIMWKTLDRAHCAHSTALFSFLSTL